MKIYAICDYDNLVKYNISLEEFVQICQTLQVQIIQYRDKNGSSTRALTNLITLRNLWQKTLIINDRIELIHFCDGLHLGQEDLKRFATNKKIAIKRVRKIIGKSLLGISTHNKKEIIEANSLDIDYIGLGAYKTSTTKNVKFVLGKRVNELSKLSKYPIAIIGGVKIADKRANIKNADYLAIGSDIIKFRDRN
jgi:thiamine-phosphate pyrophosphorylase